MTIFTWNYVLAVVAIILVTRFLPAAWRVRFIAAVSLLWIILQKSKIPRLGTVFAVISLGLLIAGWLLGRFIHNRETDKGRKQAVILGAVITLFPIVFFRYFFGELGVFRVLLMATEKFGSEAGLLLAPLGISYFTFRILCYLIEIYRKNMAPISLSEYVAYVAFFPTMLAGPIERAGAFTSQIREGKKADRDDIAIGLYRILLGLFKKLILGSFFYQLCSSVLGLPAFGPGFFTELDRFTVGQLWMTFYFNFLYIYFDFAGYSDIAIGTGRLFGIRLIENFNWPILATNISDFWQRFHISLTTWVRDYCYFPLGGSRVSDIRAAFNSILMFVLVGIWHGAARHYVVWGVYMGICLTINRHWRRWKKKRYPDWKPTWYGKLLGWSMTITCYALGLVIFQFTTTQAFYILGRMFGIK